jgi:hypothetical protein
MAGWPLHLSETVAGPMTEFADETQDPQQKKKVLLTLVSTPQRSRKARVRKAPERLDGGSLPALGVGYSVHIIPENGIIY